ncbi:MAG: iron hydrogenase small subunit, partial [Lachnospiraceae bacterium]|nr:iron hydrogenase small subunit [Lachnospiraceae bacterium]
VVIEEKAWDRNSPLIRDSSKCVKCMRCVQTCDKVQGMHVWDVCNTGSYTTVGVRDNKQFCDVNCTICGQCIVNCPVGALREHDDVTKVLMAVENPDLITVVQIAPAVRATWGEDFGLTKAFATEKRMVGALRNAGFDYIFDTTFSADLTIMEEGSELLQRLPEIKESGMPMFTSCCPGWVHFMRSEYPDMLSRLSSAKSPQGMFGAIAKTYFAEKLGVEPDKIFCVSIMPCTAKKKEITWKNSGDYVDAVLTTREMNRLIKTFFVNPEEIPEDDFDSPLGTGTGAGVIFGATGGVMEAALRSAYYLVTKKNPDPDAFKDVRGLQGWKEASFDVAGTPVKVAVASGLVNTRKLVEAIRNKEVTYDFVEILACPGGCVNGGGQPIHHDGPDVAERADVLYGLDLKNNIRYSHENPEVQKLYKEFLGEPLSHKSHELLHIEHILE